MKDAELFRPDTVRILRHRFEASESLKHHLEALVDPDHLAKESLKFYTHGQATYRLPQRGLHHPHEMERMQQKLYAEEALMTNMSERFSERGDQLRVADDELHPVRYQQREEGKMRILMYPKDAGHLSRATSTFENIPSHSEIKFHPVSLSMFYVDLAVASLHRNKQQLHEARLALENNRRLYSLSPAAIDHKDIRVRVDEQSGGESFLSGVG